MSSQIPSKQLAFHVLLHPTELQPAYYAENLAEKPTPTWEREEDSVEMQAVQTSKTRLQPSEGGTCAEKIRKRGSQIIKIAKNPFEYRQPRNKLNSIKNEIDEEPLKLGLGQITQSSDLGDNSLLCSQDKGDYSTMSVDHFIINSDSLSNAQINPQIIDEDGIIPQSHQQYKSIYQKYNAMLPPRNQQEANFQKLLLKTQPIIATPSINSQSAELPTDIASSFENANRNLIVEGCSGGTRNNSRQFQDDLNNESVPTPKLVQKSILQNSKKKTILSKTKTTEQTLIYLNQKLEADKQQEITLIIKNTQNRFKQKQQGNKSNSTHSQDSDSMENPSKPYSNNPSSTLHRGNGTASSLESDTINNKRSQGRPYPQVIVKIQKSRSKVRYECDESPDEPSTSVSIRKHGITSENDGVEPQNDPSLLQRKLRKKLKPQQSREDQLQASREMFNVPALKPMTRSKERNEMNETQALHFKYYNPNSEQSESKRYIFNKSQLRLDNSRNMSRLEDSIRKSKDGLKKGIVNNSIESLQNKTTLRLPLIGGLNIQTPQNRQKIIREDSALFSSNFKTIDDGSGKSRDHHLRQKINIPKQNFAFQTYQDINPRAQFNEGDTFDPDSAVNLASKVESPMNCDSPYYKKEQSGTLNAIEARSIIQQLLQKKASSMTAQAASQKAELPTQSILPSISPDETLYPLFSSNNGSPHSLPQPRNTGINVNIPNATQKSQQKQNSKFYVKQKRAVIQSPQIEPAQQTLQEQQRLASMISDLASQTQNYWARKQTLQLQQKIFQSPMPTTSEDLEHQVTATFKPILQETPYLAQSQLAVPQVSEPTNRSQAKRGSLLDYSFYLSNRGSVMNPYGGTIEQSVRSGSNNMFDGFKSEDEELIIDDRSMSSLIKSHAADQRKNQSLKHSRNELGSSQHLQEGESQSYKKRMYNKKKVTFDENQVTDIINGMEEHKETRQDVSSRSSKKQGLLFRAAIAEDSGDESLREALEFDPPSSPDDASSYLKSDCKTFAAQDVISSLPKIQGSPFAVCQVQSPSQDQKNRPAAQSIKELMTNDKKMSSVSQLSISPEGMAATKQRIIQAAKTP